MQRRKLFAVALAGVLATGGLAACGDSPNEGNKKAGSGVTFLTVGMPNGPQQPNQNPLATGSASLSLGYAFAVYESLMQINELKPTDPPTP